MGPDEFKSGSIPNVVTFGFKEVAPPSTLYIQRDDVLVAQVTSYIPTESVQIAVRIMLPTGPVPGQPQGSDVLVPTIPTPGGNTIVQGSFQAQVVTARVTRQTVFALMEGYLLSVAALAAQATARGNTFVRLILVRNVGAQQTAPLTLFADYVTNQQAASFPGGRYISSLETHGLTTSIQVANPIAGADWSLICASNQHLAVTSFSATFTAAVAVASRNVTIIVDDGVNTVWQDDATASITASQVASINGAQTQAAVGVITTTLFVVLPPGLELFFGWRVRSSTAAIQGADQWSNIWFAVQQWLEDA